MTTLRTIDVHAHVLTEDMMRLMRREAPDIGPTLSEVDETGGVLQVGTIVQRPFPRGAWDLELRLRDMDQAEVDVQVLSVCPQTFLYDRDPALTATLSAIQNDEISKIVRQQPDRFMGIATLPMQDPDRAVAELRRAMTQLGLSGIQTSKAATSTIRRSSRSGRQRPSSAPSSWFTRRRPQVEIA
jgi:aminocarboxymuconate-semialdehyde decarboxylase